MAGSQYSILRKTEIMIPIVVSTPSEIILAPLVDTVGWVSGIALFRVFTTNAFPSSATVHLVLKNAMVGPDDPNAVLTTTTDLLTVAATSDLDNTLYTAAIPAPIGRYLKVFIRGTASAAAGTVTMTCAVDLVGRSA